MDEKELRELAAEIARYVIENGLVDEDDELVDGDREEWWLASLGAAVAFEADERGHENATEIAEEAVRLYSKEKSGSSEATKP